MRFIDSMGRKLSGGLAVLGTLAGASVFAQESSTVTLPNTGVDVAGFASAAIISLGAVVAVVVGGIVAYMLVRAGIRWIRSMK